MKAVIVTGLSGAGKTQAIDCLEDMGYYCIDNMPPALIKLYRPYRERERHRQGRICDRCKGRQAF